MEGEMGILPEGCIANAISLTTPPDACRLSAVSKLFKSAAESDAVWERFLPPEYPSIISNSASSSSLRFSSKKELYFSLCHNPILIDDGKKSFALDKQSGKKCYMISARDLLIVWGNTPAYWIWTTVPEARFPEVAELIRVCLLEIHGKISTSCLSPGTLYTAYLVYKFTPEARRFKYQPVKVSVGLVGSEKQTRTVYFDAERGRRAAMPNENDGCYPKRREDEWLEIEFGDFFNKGDEDGDLEISVLDGGPYWKSGLIIQGIEIRPKQGK